MRAVVFIIIAGVAGLIGYMALFNRCEGSQVATMADCERAFANAGFCRRVLSRFDEAIAVAGNVYKTHADCSATYRNCIEYPGVHGWTPKPVSFCVVRDSAGDLRKMTPIYDR